MRQKGFTPIIIPLIIVILVVVGYFAFKQGYINSILPKPTPCGGWDTSGEVKCKCSGKLIKPTCEPKAICDAETYYCQGECTDCCYQGIAENHPLPKCNN